MSNIDDEEDDEQKRVKIPKYTVFFQDIDKKNFEKILEFAVTSLIDSVYDKETCTKLKKKLDADEELNKPSTTNDKDKNNLIEEHGVWQVIVGKSYVASVTFDAKHLIYFRFDELKKYFLIFRS